MAVEILLRDSAQEVVELRRRRKGTTPEESADAKMRHDINYQGVQVGSPSKRDGDECEMIAIAAQ